MVSVLRDNRRPSGFTLVLSCVVLLTLQNASRAEATKDAKEDYEARARELVSPDPGVRFNALGVLTKALNRSTFDGSSFDLSGKCELFRKVVEIGSLGHVSGVAHLLSRLPEDATLVQFAEDTIKTEGTRPDTGEASLLLVGALAYLENQRPAVFESYFNGKRYEDLSETFRQTFATSAIVVKLRDDFYRELVLAFIQWKPSQNGPLDQNNPLRAKIVELGPSLTPTIAATYASSDSVLPLSLIWVLGEVGDRGAFDLLLREYLARPSMRTAISLGSCLGSLSMNKLFEAPFTPDSIRELLQHVYGRTWASVKDLSLTELKDNLSKNLEAIRADCKLRSVPQLG